MNLNDEVLSKNLEEMSSKDICQDIYYLYNTLSAFNSRLNDLKNEIKFRCAKDETEIKTPCIGEKTGYVRVFRTVPSKKIVKMVNEKAISKEEMKELMDKGYIYEKNTAKSPYYTVGVYEDVVEEEEVEDDQNSIAS